MRVEPRENVPLAPFTTLGVGGPARFYVRVDDAASLAGALEWAERRAQPVLVLGGGSNLVVSDDGHPGLVIHLALRGVAARRSGDTVDVTVAAGEYWDPLVAFAADKGWAGIECLSGIPGFVGATPIQNVGAYGQDVSETIVAVEAMDAWTRVRATFDNEACRFGYRMSRFKSDDRGRFVVIGVTFRLRPGGVPALKYADLSRYFAERGVAAPSLAETRQAVIEVRRRKSMVLDPEDPNARSVGSFFMNPVVSADEFERVAARIIADGVAASRDEIPHYPGGADRLKMSAAWLIERAGFLRGYRRGPVAISEKHTLALVNRGGATAADVLALAREVRDGVRDRFGICLHPEPVFVGISLDE
jgi:UDP-N-acetylmuramate dehydrogenase